MDFLMGLLKIFVSILDGIKSLVAFVSSFSSDGIYLIKLLASFVTRAREFVSWLPGPVTLIIGSVFTIAVVYKVLGREG